MKDEYCRSMDFRPLRHLPRIFLTNTSVALGVFALNVVFTQDRSWSRLSEFLWIDLVYSNVIGTMAALLLPPVVARVAARQPAFKRSALVALLLAISLAGTLAATVALKVIGVVGDGAFWRWYRSSVQIVIVITLMVGSAVVLIEHLRTQVQATALELKRHQLERERALKLAAEARLNSLESRLKPHFLFNTINSVLSLIREDPRAAEQMLERLSRLLRSALDAEPARLHALRNELRLVEDYLLIEHARFGDRLRFEVDAPEELGSIPVPPYCLQTLVENSMKHAIATRRDGGWLRVAVRKEGDAIMLEVMDSGPGFSRDQITEGHGLDTLEKRLEVLFGAGARLEVNDERQGAVRLRLPCEVMV
jgi:two-component system sensor histidine kinase AlgZ